MWLAAGGLAALGCSSASGNGAQAGELGRGTFSYVCGPGADAQCNSNADLPIVDPSTNLPPVALGSLFDLDYAPGRVESDDEAVLPVVDNQWFYAKGSGYVAVVGSKGGTADDLVHVLVEPIDHLEFAQSAVTGGSFMGEVTVPGLTATVTVNGGPLTQYYRVVPLTQDRKLLAGGLPCMWTSSNPSVGRVVSDPAQNIVQVQFSQNGMVTFHVTLGSAAGDVNVTVGS
jgi:hypothetical protein